MLREFLSQHELRCVTTSKLVDQLIVQLVQQDFWVVTSRECFIQPLSSSDYSIDHCFDDMLEQQGVALSTCVLTLNTSTESCL